MALVRTQHRATMDDVARLEWAHKELKAATHQVMVAEARKAVVA